MVISYATRELIRECWEIMLEDKSNLRVEDLFLAIMVAQGGMTREVSWEDSAHKSCPRYEGNE